MERHFSLRIDRRWWFLNLHSQNHRVSRYLDDQRIQHIADVTITGFPNRVLRRVEPRLDDVRPVVAREPALVEAVVH